MFGWRQPKTGDKKEERYSLEKVRALLDQVGLYRLRVIDPRLKVLLTLIAQRGEGRLMRNSVNGQLSDSDVMTFQDLLESLVRVLEKYVEIQNDPSQGQDVEELLASGLNAAEGFATQVLKSDAPGGQTSMTTFRVDTQILSAQRFR